MPVADDPVIWFTRTLLNAQITSPARKSAKLITADTPDPVSPLPTSNLNEPGIYSPLLTSKLEGTCYSHRREEAQSL